MLTHARAWLQIVKKYDKVSGESNLGPFMARVQGESFHTGSYVEDLNKVPSACGHRCASCSRLTPPHLHQAFFRRVMSMPEVQSHLPRWWRGMAEHHRQAV